MGISYVMATKNKLSYLNTSLPLLIEAKRLDDEIIVVDGDSTDGTKEYVSSLWRQGLINIFISEPDLCQAHASNKGILAVTKPIFMLVHSDDIFNYEMLQKCSDFMELHPELEVICSDGANASLTKPGQAERHPSLEEPYRRYCRRGEPFSFNDAGLVVQRSSLPKIGLLHLGFREISLEWSLRMSSTSLNLAYCRGVGYVWFLHPDSTSLKYSNIIGSEILKLRRFYLENYLTWPDLMRQKARELRLMLRQTKNRISHRDSSASTASIPINQHQNLSELYSQYVRWLAAENQQHPPVILWQDREITLDDDARS